MLLDAFFFPFFQKTADLKRLMTRLLEEVNNGMSDDAKDEDDPTRLISFVQFLHGWVDCCNINFEIKSRNVQIKKDVKPKDALLIHVALDAKRQAELMAHARSQGWEMKRLARIEIERTRRAQEKQSEKESSNARKGLALKEKSDRIADKAGTFKKCVSKFLEVVSVLDYPFHYTVYILCNYCKNI